MTFESMDENTPRDIIGNLTHEALTDGTKHELYLLMSTIAMEYDANPRQIDDEDDGSYLDYFARFEPSPELMIKIERRTRPFTAFGFMESKTGSVSVYDKSDIKWHRYEWDFDDSSGGLTVELDHHSYYPPNSPDEILHDLGLWLFRRHRHLTDEERIRLQLIDDKFEERHREEARRKQEGLDKPTEQQAHELINLLKALKPEAFRQRGEDT